MTWTKTLRRFSLSLSIHICMAEHGALLFLSDLCQKGVQKHGQVFGCKVEPTCRNGMSHSKIQFQIQRRDGSRQTTIAGHLLFFSLTLR
jgi:hypothetical protein